MGFLMLKNYLKKITEIAIRGDDREESYYSTLENLLLEYLNSTNRAYIKVDYASQKDRGRKPPISVSGTESSI